MHAPMQPCAFLIALALCLSHPAPARAYVYPCFDRCACNTDEQLVDCHDRRFDGQPHARIRARMPLHGFTVLSLRDNCFESVGEPAQLKAVLPDLQFVDFELNPTDCEELVAKTAAFESAGVQTLHDCKPDDATRTQRRLAKDVKCRLSASLLSTACERNVLDCTAREGFEKVKEVVLEAWDSFEKFWNENKRKIPGYELAEGFYRHLFD